MNKYLLFFIIALMSKAGSSMATSTDTLPNLKKWERQREYLNASSFTYSKDSGLEVVDSFQDVLRYTAKKSKKTYIIEFWTTDVSVYKSYQNRVQKTTQRFIDSTHLTILDEKGGKSINAENHTFYLQSTEIMTDIVRADSNNAELNKIIDNFLTTQNLDQFQVNNFRTERMIKKAAFEMKQHLSKKPVFYLGLSYTPSIAYRNLTINALNYNQQDQHIDRNYAERNIFGNRLDFNVGITNNGKSHYYLSLFRQQMGFQSYESPLIDWKSGSHIGGAVENITYRFQQLGFGLGYRYVGFSDHSILAPIFDVNIYYARMRKYTVRQGEDFEVLKAVRNRYLKPDQFGAQIGLGLAFRFNYNIDFYLMPSVNANFTSINFGKEYKVYLINSGIQFGLNYRIRFI